MYTCWPINTRIERSFPVTHFIPHQYFIHCISFRCCFIYPFFGGGFDSAYQDEVAYRAGEICLSLCLRMRRTLVYQAPKPHANWSLLLRMCSSFALKLKQTRRTHTNARLCFILTDILNVALQLPEVILGFYLVVFILFIQSRTTSCSPFPVCVYHICSPNFCVTWIPKCASVCVSVCFISLPAWVHTYIY